MKYPGSFWNAFFSNAFKPVNGLIVLLREARNDNYESPRSFLLKNGSVLIILLGLAAAILIIKLS